MGTCNLHARYMQGEQYTHGECGSLIKIREIGTCVLNGAQGTAVLATRSALQPGANMLACGTETMVRSDTNDG